MPSAAPPRWRAASVTIGARRVPWDDLLWFDLRDGESLLLAQRAVDAVVELDLLDSRDVPVLLRGRYVARRPSGDTLTPASSSRRRIRNWNVDHAPRRASNIR